MPTKRQSIVDAVKTRLATITVANGYRTNIGQHVTEWLPDFWDSTLVPAVNFRDPKEVQQQLTPQQHDRRLSIELDILVVSGATTPADVRKAIADIEQAIQTDRKWSNLAYDTDPVEDEIDFKRAGKLVGGAVKKFIIKYRTQNFNPDA